MVMSVLMAAMRAKSLDFPASTGLSQKALILLACSGLL
jgi:hypothetical protein